MTGPGALPAYSTSRERLLRSTATGKIGPRTGSLAIDPPPANHSGPRTAGEDGPDRTGSGGVLRRVGGVVLIPNQRTASWLNTSGGADRQEQADGGGMTTCCSHLDAGGGAAGDSIIP